MWASKAYAVVLTGISGIGTLTNFTSYFYIKKTFDTDINVFSILAKDSLANGVCIGLFFITNIINISDEDVLRSKIGCNLFAYGICVPTVLGPVTSMMISLRRFFHLKFPTLVQDNSKVVQRIVSIGIGTVFVFPIVHLSFLQNEFTKLCLGAEEENPILVSFIIFFSSPVKLLDPWSSFALYI